MLLDHIYSHILLVCCWTTSCGSSDTSKSGSPFSCAKHHTRTHHTCLASCPLVWSASFPISSCLVLFRLFLDMSWFYSLSHLILSYLIISYLIISYLVLSYYILSILFYSISISMCVCRGVQYSSVCVEEY